MFDLSWIRDDPEAFDHAMARRMQARFRRKGGKGTRFVDSLNGSGIAVGRALIAIMETHQRRDGSIAIPAALRPCPGGMEVLGRDG